MKKIEIRYINDLLFYILLFFGLFDAARNYTPLPEWIGYSKDIAIFLLYVLNCRKVRFLPQKLIYIQSVFWFIWGFAGILYSGGYSTVKILIGIIKYLEFFMLITLFYNWDALFHMSIGHALKLYIRGSLCIFIVNVIGYYIPNPVCYVGLSNGNLTAGYYGGRISVGQPPIAALPMLISCVYLMFCENTSTAKIIFLMSGIILSTTNTGIVALGICCVIYAGYFWASGKKIAKKYIYLALAVLGIGMIFHRELYIVFEDQILMYRRKLFAVLGGGKDASMEGRKRNWEFALSTLRTNRQWMFGRGMYGFCIGGEYHYVENTYVALICTYGIAGLGLFLVYLFDMLLRYVRIFFNEHDEKYLFGICLVLIYLLHMYTLDTFLVYTMSFGFGFFNMVIDKGNPQLHRDVGV